MITAVKPGPSVPSAVVQARSMHMYLFQENLRYDLMAQDLGAAGEYVRTPADLREALGRGYERAVRDRVSTLINVQGLKSSPPGRCILRGTSSIPSRASAPSPIEAVRRWRR